MIRFSLLIALCLISPLLIAQSDFQKGYFIDINGNRQDGYVSVRSWSDNPRAFAFRTEPASSNQTVSVSSATEVGAGASKYVRFIGRVDSSSSKTRKMSNFKEPEWVHDSLFVRVLVDGNADLFYCERAGEERFFYRVDDGPITQLVFKLYEKESTRNEPRQVAKNREYLGQLREGVNCLQYSFEKMKSVRYEIAVLTNYFTEQNECSGGNQYTAKDEVSRRMISVRATPGFNIAQMDSYTMKQGLYESYEQKLCYRMGAEFEFTLPFHRKKWALWLEPAFQAYKANGTDSAARSITYTSFEVALGARHYFYLGKRSNIFLNAAGVFDVPIESTGGWEGRNNTPSNSDKTFNFAAGVGATYGRFSIEARYYTTRKMNGTAGVLLPNGDTGLFKVQNEFQKVSVIIGYRVF
ncbi:hypothetical protein WBG78_00775 [Chryseolinea sp. T2]|uniref:hypothetical protein n=1 Tax=Chryseolinea sp. T2 TaxID=3129255 RepID=UPI0030776F13